MKGAYGDLVKQEIIKRHIIKVIIEKNYKPITKAILKHTA